MTCSPSQAFYSLIIAAPAAVKLPTLDPTATAGLVLAAIVVTIGQLVMTRAYQFMSVSRGSSLQMLLPLVTAAGSAAFFSETFHAMEIAGALLTLLATWRVVVSR